MISAQVRKITQQSQARIVVLSGLIVLIFFLGWAKTKIFTNVAPIVLTYPDSTEAFSYFGSHIELRKNGEIAVTEKITVLVEGKRGTIGLGRRMPKKVFSKAGKPQLTTYKIVSAKHNNKLVKYTIVKNEHFDVLTLKKEKGNLELGEHTYEIKYTVKGAVHRLPEYDELVWDVAGNYWPIPIKSAVAVLKLPKSLEAKAVVHEGRVVKIGQEPGEVSVKIENKHSLKFWPKHEMEPRSGFYIHAAWPKGFIK